MPCPKCGSKRIKWRQGLHFDNEMICYKCWHSFDPNDGHSSKVPPQPKEEEIEDLKAARKRINRQLKKLLTKTNREDAKKANDKALQSWKKQVQTTLDTGKGKYADIAIRDLHDWLRLIALLEKNQLRKADLFYRRMNTEVPSDVYEIFRPDEEDEI